MTTPTPQRPWLVGDIGGTNARFGLLTHPGTAPRHIRILRVADHPDLAAAITAYLGHTPTARPTAACVAVAGPVDGDTFHLTNAAWQFSRALTQDRLGLTALTLLNDFQALALALPHLEQTALRPIGTATPAPGKPLAVLGPGTGLGVAGLLPTPTGWTPVPGEGGHVTLPAETRREADVLAHLRTTHGCASAEYVLSGPGLARLYGALAALTGTTPEQLAPKEIAARGQAGTDRLCTETVQMFCALLGSFAGNVALTLGARGGLFLGGGILPAMADTLAASDFRHRFEDKASMPGYTAAIATQLITAPTPALLGAAAHLAHHQGALTPS